VVCWCAAERANVRQTRRPIALPSLNVPMPSDSRDWTVTHVYRASFADLRRRPFGTFLLLGVFPSLWAWPVDLVFAPISNGHVLHDMSGVTSELARVLWGSVFRGGEFLVALNVARGGSPRISDLFRGPRFAVRVAMLSVVTILATNLAFFVRLASLASAETMGFLFAAIGVAFVVLIRGSLSDMILVDTRSSAWRALTESWSTTRGYSWRIAGVYFLLLVVVVPISVAFRAPLAARSIGVVVFPVVILALAHIYLLTAPSLRQSGGNSDELDSGATVVGPNDDLPVRGTGWSRTVPRKRGEQ